MTKLIFHFYFCLTPMCSQAALISFAGAEKDLGILCLLKGSNKQGQALSGAAMTDRQ